MQADLKSNSLVGVIVAGVIVAIWISSLTFLLLINIAKITSFWTLLAILGRTFIQTGLFIVTHDAIHGAIVPSNRHWNDLIGRLTATLYALLSYQKLSINHWRHHQYPGQANDPDFHDGIHPGILAWYARFMKGYLNARQQVVIFWGIGIIFLILHWGFHIPVANLFLFWVLPIIFSSMQLFLFGTYLPHRSCLSNGEVDAAKNVHYATSSNFSLIFSFLTCYHFGYHWEHHEYPGLAWYELPSARSRTRYAPIDKSGIVVNN